MSRPYFRGGLAGCNLRAVFGCIIAKSVIVIATAFPLELRQAFFDATKFFALLTWRFASAVI